MTDTTNNTPYPRNKILTLLSDFAESRPGMDSREYGGATACWHSDRYTCRTHLNDARELLRFCRLVGLDITPRNFSAFSGRLEYVPAEGDKPARLDYCEGQYYPTEFRAAVCAVLASAIRTYYRDTTENATGDSLRARARADFRTGIVNRWFN